jgi:hypothetical protein
MAYRDWGRVAGLATAAQLAVAVVVVPALRGGQRQVPLVTTE